jgi:hypothetical protein
MTLRRSQAGVSHYASAWPGSASPAHWDARMESAPKLCSRCQRVPVMAAGLCLRCALDEIGYVQKQILRLRFLLVKRSGDGLQAGLREFRLDDEARDGEMAAELKVRRCVLALARSQEWPELGISRPGGGTDIALSSRAQWERFAHGGTPLMLVRAVAALWPDFGTSRGAEAP